MDKKESRAIIKYLHKMGMKIMDIHDDMVKTFDENFACYSTVN